MSIARSTAPASSSGPISRAPTRCWKRPSSIGAACRPSARGAISLPSRFDRRGVRLARAGGQVRRREPLPAQFTLCRVEGRLGPPRARLARDVRPADRAEQLLEQLRPLPVPRKADPAGDPEGAARQADPGLRQGRQRARLAARRGSCPRAPRRADAGAPRRELQYRRRRRAHQSRRRDRRFAHCSTRCGRARRTGRTRA